MNALPYERRELEVMAKTKEISEDKERIADMLMDYPEQFAALLLGVMGGNYCDAALEIRQYIQQIALARAEEDVPSVSDELHWGGEFDHEENR